MTVAGNAIRVETPAKINLTLEILGKRSDGYHELRSVVMPVSLADTISMTTTYAQTALTLTVESGVDRSKMGSFEGNLAVRAARLMQQRYRVNAGARIHIHKRIPIGGGLGGGSANAAGVIRGLNKLWGLRRPLVELVELGAELGSDVPALVHGGAVLMEGRGERVRGLFDKGCVPPERGFWLVIANPGVMCSTPEIFKNYKPGLTPPPKILHNMTSSIQSCNVETAAGALFNGLQERVFACYPRVAETAEMLLAAGSPGVLLSGSGASVFGLAYSREHGMEISRSLGVRLWRKIVCTCPVV